MTKTLNQICFPPPKSEYFLQQHWESDYILRKKTYQGTLAILDEACLSVGKVTDEVRTARQRSNGYTG